jgi:hypothetical protein
MEALRKVWDLWKRFGQIMGDFVARVVLTLFYFTVFLPFGIGVRLLRDPLAIKGRGQPRWVERRTRDRVLDDSRRLS